jgi:acetyl-CoA decarbonylase/synthase complex subunit alpha
MTQLADKVTKHQAEKNEIIRADDPWEPVGHTPMPGLPDLRNWDMRLLKTYKPFYAPFCDLCCFCTFGKCDLTGSNRGACGIDIASQQARFFLFDTCMGMSAHGAHGRHVIDYLIEKYGEDYKIDLGDQVEVEAPNIRTVLGLKPKTLGDLKKAVEYVEGELIHLISSLHTGMEGSCLDFESKALHAGMLDHVAMEAADIAQIAGFKYPTSVAETPLVGLGWGAVDKNKAVVLCVGHNPVTALPIVDYINANNLQDKVEVAGICCTAQELGRYSKAAKVVGPLSRELFFLRCGIADCVVTDEQCIRCDTPIEAAKQGAGMIATSDKVCYGLENVSEKTPDEIVNAMVNDGKQVLILDPDKAAEVAVRVALALRPKRNKVITTKEQLQGLAKDHKLCNACTRACANLLPVGDAIEAAQKGDISKLVDVFERCIGCGKCEQACPRHVPIFKMFQGAAAWESWNIRGGRGPIMDVEIRKVGQPIVFGTIPGVVAFVGCSNYEHIEDVAVMAEEFAKRKFIVVLSGCAAMVAGMKKDADGKTIYEKYTPQFDAGCIVNVGSCVANSHISGAAMKIANIFAKLPLRGNYEVIADYILNRVGAVGVAWGAYSQKATAIANGCNRLGIPVILGAEGTKYRRLFLSRNEEDDWRVKDGRTGQDIDTGEPSPEHLAYVVETRERCMVTIAKLVMRKNDTPQGRQIKLTHYIGLHKQFMGTLPDDLQHYVRRSTDIPIFFKKEVTEYLNRVGWKEKPVLTLPTWIGTYPTKVPLDAVVH